MVIHLDKNNYVDPDFEKRQARRTAQVENERKGLKKERKYTTSTMQGNKAVTYIAGMLHL